MVKIQGSTLGEGTSYPFGVVDLHPGKVTQNSKIESLYKLHREIYVMLSRFKRLDDFYISRKFPEWVLSIKPDPDLVAAISVFDRKDAMCSAKFEAILRQCKELRDMEERRNSGDGRPMARGPAEVTAYVDLLRSLEDEMSIDVIPAATVCDDLDTNVNLQHDVPDEFSGQPPIQPLPDDGVGMQDLKLQDEIQEMQESGIAGTPAGLPVLESKGDGGSGNGLQLARDIMGSNDKDKDALSGETGNEFQKFEDAIKRALPIITILTALMNQKDEEPAVKTMLQQCQEAQQAMMAGMSDADLMNSVEKKSEDDCKRALEEHTKLRRKLDILGL